VAIAGTVIVSSLVSAANAGYALALVVLGLFAAVGLVAAIMLPTAPAPVVATEPSPAT